MNSSLFQTSGKSFGEFFKENRICIVPNYQRPYAWNVEKHVPELWEDILDAMNMHCKLKEKDQSINIPYYLGSIYLQPYNAKSGKELIDDSISEQLKNIIDNPYTDNMDEIKYSFLVDGQQRLTTLYLLLFHLFKKQKHELTHKLQVGETKKLFLNGNDDQFFAKLLKNDKDVENLKPATLSQEKLLETYNYFKVKIDSSDFDSNSLIEFIKNRLIIIQIELQIPDFAIQLFQTQNDRGKQLTFLERMKSLFMLFEDKYNPKNDDIMQKINRVFGKLYHAIDKSMKHKIYEKGSTGENEFVRTVYTYLQIDKDRDAMYHDIESIYDNYFKGKLKKANKDSLLINKQIDNWIGKLKNGSCWLNYLNDNIRKEQYKILFHSLRLSLRSRALLLSFQSNFPDVDLDSREFQISKANTDIYDIVDKKINEIKNNYSALWYDNNISQHFKDLINGFEAQLSELRKKQKTTVNLSILDLVELIELCIWNAGSNPRAGFMNSWDWAFNSSDNDKIAAFNAFWNGLGVSGKRYNLIESILYWSGMDSQFRYVLKEFERSKHNNNIHFCNITMEHIFPQTPKKDFIFKEWGFRDEEEYEGFKNKSYNLALLEGGSPQAQAGNQPIIVIKSNVYKTQNLVKSTKKLGDILGEVAIRMKNNISPLYRTRLELRSIELALFAIERF